MSKNINGTEYKIVYLDTNAISDISKNYRDTATNLLKYFQFMEAFPKERYAFATSIYNIKELSKTLKYREDIVNVFDKIPLLIVDVFPNIISKEVNNDDFVLFGTGIKPLFNISISDLFFMLENDELDETNKIFEENISKELVNWNEIRYNSIYNQKELFNNSYKIYNKCNNNINRCFNTRSGKIFAFIKYYFLFKQNKKITSNCVIDAFNASVAPLVGVYVGEKSVISWLKESKNKYDFMKNVEFIKISSFYKKENDKNI